jgi:CheY-like chemotaxis protein
VHLFKPFSQIDSGLARKFEGTGLGLAMVKLLAELHGGSVAVESAVGQGSRFTVWLPVRAEACAASIAGTAPVAARPARETKEAMLHAASSLPVASLPSIADEAGVVSPAHGAGQKTALVVEDDFKSAELVRVQLEAEGFTVVHAPSAEAALVLATQQPLALITLDIMLPEMDGWEFLERIKQTPALSSIPVVIISIVADRKRGFAMGAAAVVQKPLSRDAFVASLLELRLYPRRADQSLRVLVVDADPITAAKMEECVRGIASDVVCVADGARAVAAAQTEVPDLIVLDLVLGELSGFHVADALHADVRTASIPIIVVSTAPVSVADRERLSGSVSSIMERTSVGDGRFLAEVRRAMAGRAEAR